MRIPNIYPFDSNNIPWDYCYLHGEAEKIFNQDFSDLFTADMPMPQKAGSYPVLIDGIPAVAVIANRYGYLSGRVVLVSDTEALKHALNPDEWR